MVNAIRGLLKALLLALGSALASLLLSSVALAATDTNPGGDYWEILDAHSTYAEFSLLDEDECDDSEDRNVEYCTVFVRETGSTSSSRRSATTSSDSTWADLFDDLCGSGTNEVDGSPARYSEEFEDCWDAANFDVQWPVITLRDDFDITPHCQRNDDECAVELEVCYSADDCDQDDNDESDAEDADSFSEIGWLWRRAGDCIYDEDRDEVWECIDDEFQDWLDDELSRNDDYDDLLEEVARRDPGFVIERYSDDLNDVGDGSSSSSGSSQTTIQRYQRQWDSATPRAISRAASEVETGGPRFRPSGAIEEYLTLDFTAYLEGGSSTRVCNTSIGCFNLVGQSGFFRQYLQGFHIVLDEQSNRKVVDCVDDKGWDVDDDHAIPFDHAYLVECDERVKKAVDLCPAAGLGTQYILFEMYDMGLLNGIITDQTAQQIRRDLERAREVAPECLCAAGFEERDMAVATHADSDPWASVGTKLVEEGDVCD